MRQENQNNPQSSLLTKQLKSTSQPYVKKKKKKKANTISPFKPPFLSTAAGPPLQVEGYNIPTVSEGEFVSVHLSPPGSERQGASLP